MTETLRPDSEPRADSGIDTDVATASPQQREAIVEEVCQAILIESGSARAGEPG